MSQDKTKSKLRRRALLAKAGYNQGVGINNCYQRQLSKDPDLKWLLKRGFIRLVRLSCGGRKMQTMAQATPAGRIYR
jgi:hypothetical protein